MAGQLDIYALLGTDAAPIKLTPRAPLNSDDAYDSQGFIHAGTQYASYFAPEAYSTLVVFGIGNWLAVRRDADFVVSLAFGDTVKQRVAVLNDQQRSWVAEMKWSASEIAAIEALASEQRLAKLTVKVEMLSSSYLAASPPSMNSSALECSAPSTPASTQSGAASASIWEIASEAAPPCTPPKASAPATPSTKSGGGRKRAASTPDKKASGASGAGGEGRGTASPAGGSKRVRMDHESTALVGSALGDLPTPSARWGMTFTLLGGSSRNAVLFGGQGNNQDMVKDTVWMLEDGCKWVQLETTGTAPALRMGHSSVAHNGQIYTFGGSRKMRWFNDLFTLDTTSNTWTTVQFTGQSPSASYHSVFTIRGDMFVFGGIHGHQSDRIPDVCKNELHVFNFDLRNWYRPSVFGDVPSPRSGHSAVVADDERVFIFGGWDAPECYDDLFTFDAVMMEFTKVATHGARPSARSWHAALLLPGNRMLIYGGFDGNLPMGDAFLLDLATMTWHKVTNPELSKPRAGHAMILLPAVSGNAHEDTICVFGGGDNDDGFYNDVVTLRADRITLG